MQAVIELAKLRKWRHFHVLRSKGSPAGFPDLVRDGKILFIELKTETGSLTPAQKDWQLTFAAAPVSKPLCFARAIGRRLSECFGKEKSPKTRPSPQHLREKKCSDDNLWHRHLNPKMIALG